MSLFIDFMALLLVACIGFAAHRATLCTVKAVSEVLTSGTAYMFASFVKAVLWAALVYGAILLALPAPASGFSPYDSRLLLIAGAFLFGVGAAVNGGCSMSTLQKLADGDLRMLATLAGFAAGALGWSAIHLAFDIKYGAREPVAWETLGSTGYGLIALLASWGIWELRRMWRERPREVAWWRLPLAEVYRLSTAAAVIGIVGGLLYGVKGAWSYTYYLRTHVDATFRGVEAPPLLHVLLFAALFTGMVASAAQRHSLHVHGATPRALMPHLCGGLLMGVGAGMVPGGNDTLMLVALPTLSSWALAAYVALLAGIAVALVLMRRMGAPLSRVQCPNDVCSERPRDTGGLPPA